jgi:hypothetical protein
LCGVEVATIFVYTDGEFHPDELGGIGVIGEEKAEYVGTVDGTRRSREDLMETNEVFAEEEVQPLIEVVSLG